MKYCSQHFFLEVVFTPGNSADVLEVFILYQLVNCIFLKIMIQMDTKSAREQTALMVVAC